MSASPRAPRTAELASRREEYDRAVRAERYASDRNEDSTQLMARLFLADSQRDALTEMGRMDGQQAEQLVGAFDQLGAYLTIDGLVAAAQEAAPSLQSADDLIVTLLGLTTETRQLESSQVGQLVRDALEREPLPISVDISRVVDVVRRLTATRALRTSANAHEVLAQHDRNFQAARIFTDLRPLFDTDPSEPPSGAVIVEMLQLETWSGDGRSETVRVAMDRADLLSLREVIDRAITKTDSLRRLMEEAGITSFELGDYSE